jgi:hypothetical protein
VKNIVAEILGDLACAIIILVSIKLLELASDALWPNGLVFFTEDNLIPLHARTLFDVAYVLIVVVFLGFGVWDFIKVFRK